MKNTATSILTNRQLQSLISESVSLQENLDYYKDAKRIAQGHLSNIKRELNGYQDKLAASLFNEISQHEQTILYIIGQLNK